MASSGCRAPSGTVPVSVRVDTFLLLVLAYSESRDCKWFYRCLCPVAVISGDGARDETRCLALSPFLQDFSLKPEDGLSGDAMRGRAVSQPL